MKHEFVRYIPNHLVYGVIYVSVEFCTANHLCCCGCGLEVVTPLAPESWRLIYNGETVSLHPSIGNWQFPCKSHYWIIDNEIVWVEDWFPETDNGSQWLAMYENNNSHGERANTFYTWLKRILK